MHGKGGGSWCTEYFVWYGFGDGNSNLREGKGQGAGLGDGDILSTVYSVVCWRAVSAGAGCSSAESQLTRTTRAGGVFGWKQMARMKQFGWELD